MRNAWILSAWALVYACTLPQAWAGLSGSKHDFSSLGWAGNSLCNPCHTPHNAIAGERALWNHQLSQATYTLYSSSSMAQTSIGPNATSKLCLSCHDGTVALDSFGGNSGSTFINGAANLGTDLSNDHPIGIIWTHSAENAYDCLICHDGNPAEPWTLTKRSDMPLYPTPDGSGGYDYTVECTSCHEPHNSNNQESLLKVSLTGSALCLQCHPK